MTVEILLKKNKEIMDLLEDRISVSILHNARDTNILKQNIASALKTLNSKPSLILKNSQNASEENFNKIRSLLNACLNEISEMESQAA